MREIKFRAWDKESNVMIYSDSVYPRSSYKLEFDILNDMEFTLTKMIDRVNVYYEDGEETYIEIFNKVDAELMQYTGLKDKNGKEIYEGDILSYKHIKYTDCSKEEIEDIEKEVLIGLITYRPLASIIKPYSENVMCLGYDNINKECLVIDLESEELEVLGNVYDNPELLK